MFPTRHNNDTISQDSHWQPYHTERPNDYRYSLRDTAAITPNIANKFDTKNEFILNASEKHTIPAIHKIGNITRKKGKRKKLYSDYKGVTYNKWHAKFQSCITHNNKQYYLGCYQSAVDAEKAYDDGARVLKSKVWKKNFVTVDEYKTAKAREEKQLQFKEHIHALNLNGKASKRIRIIAYLLMINIHHTNVNTELTKYLILYSRSTIYLLATDQIKLYHLSLL